MKSSIQVAKDLLKIGAVGFSLKNPITFKSGILSPVYVDNRKFPFNPTQWQHMLTALQQLIVSDKVKFDIVSGVETAGIPHSAVLGFLLKKPSVFVRKAVKDHGMKKLVEGGDVKGKRVLIIEDHMTTGGSSLQSVINLREAGAIVTDCLCITRYDFPEIDAAFAAAHVKLHVSTTFSEILAEAIKQKKLKATDVKNIELWMQDPHAWGEKYRTK